MPSTRFSLEEGETGFGFSAGLVAGVFSALGVGTAAAGGDLTVGAVVFAVFVAVLDGGGSALLVLAFAEDFPLFGEVVGTAEVFVFVLEFAGTGIC